MRWTRLSTLLLPLAVVGAALTDCGGSGSLKPPISDSQYDDPCDPGSSSGVGVSPPPVDGGSQVLVLPDGAPGIGFEDLAFSGTLGRLLVPGGRSGNLVLVDPSMLAVGVVGGFATAPTYDGQSDVGVVSADEGNGIVYAVDRTRARLAVVDVGQSAIVATVATASTPGFVRYVAPTKEVWVTEPDQHRLEVFAIGAGETTPPAHAAFIDVSDGPQSLAVDAAHGRVFTHGATSTYRIDAASHAVTAQWPNGCTTSKGIAVDPARGWVISACEEGRVVVLDAQGGATVGTAAVGGGVDQIAYDAQRMRLYVPSTSAAAMAVVALSPTAPPFVLGALATASDSHCAVTNGGGSVFACAPSRGALLVLRDPF
jgi:hypothetical protein